jgi:hypothetical protein
MFHSKISTPRLKKNITISGANYRSTGTYSDQLKHVNSRDGHLADEF